MFRPAALCIHSFYYRQRPLLAKTSSRNIAWSVKPKPNLQQTYSHDVNGFRTIVLFTSYLFVTFIGISPTSIFGPGHCPTDRDYIKISSSSVISILFYLPQGNRALARSDHDSDLSVFLPPRPAALQYFICKLNVEGDSYCRALICTLIMSRKGYWVHTLLSW